MDDDTKTFTKSPKKAYEASDSYPALSVFFNFIEGVIIVAPVNVVAFGDYN